MDLTADASAKLGGSGVSVVSGGSASVESQSSLALSVDESSSDGVQVSAGIVLLSSTQALLPMRLLNALQCVLVQY